MTGEVNFDDRALNYNRVAGAYEAGRPGYQDHLVNRVLELFDASPQDVIVDLAAGTGKFSRCLSSALGSVVAIEPVAAMANQLSEVVTDISVARAYAGRLPLRTASIAGMSVAQAFQWFDQTDIPEIARVLHPGAVLALVWNRRQDTRDWAVVSPVLAPFRNRDRRRIDAPAVLGASGVFGAAEVEQWPWVRTIGRDQLHDHISSLSWVAALDDDTRAHLRRDIDHALGGTETHQLDYVSELIFARRL